MDGTQVLEKNSAAVECFAQRVEQATLEPPSLIISLSSEKERQRLERIVASCHWTVYGAASCEETIRLAQSIHPSVILCDAELADGGWQRIWKALSNDVKPPRVIVASRNADENLWVQVLSEGGHDVLLKPFVAEEVTWSIGCAVAQRECRVCCASGSGVS